MIKEIKQQEMYKIIILRIIRIFLVISHNFFFFFSLQIPCHKNVFIQNCNSTNKKKCYVSVLFRKTRFLCCSYVNQLA